MATVLRGVRSASVGTTATAVGAYTAPSVSTGVVITGLVLANQSASTITATCYILSGGVNYYLCFGSTIVAGGTLVLADEGNRVVLNSGDQLLVLSNTAGTLAAVMSVAEIT